MKHWPWIAVAVVTVVVVIVLSRISTDTGQAAYETHCARCHGAEGEGFKDLYPPLAGVDYLQTHREQLPCIIRHGLEGRMVIQGKEYDLPMIGNPALSPLEIANIINYVNSNWGNDGAFMHVDEVERLLRECAAVREE